MKMSMRIALVAALFTSSASIVLAFPMTPMPKPYAASFPMTPMPKPFAASFPMTPMPKPSLSFTSASTSVILFRFSL